MWKIAIQRAREGTVREMEGKQGELYFRSKESCGARNKGNDQLVENC